MEQERRDRIYRMYVTKCLQLIPQHQALKVSFEDVVKPKKVVEKTGDELVLEVMKKAGLTLAAKEGEKT